MNVLCKTYARSFLTVGCDDPENRQYHAFPAVSRRNNR